MSGLKLSWSLEPVPRNFLRLTRSLLPSWHEVLRWHCWAPFSATLETGKGHREDCQAKNNSKLKHVTSTKSGQARWSTYMYILLAVRCCQFVECEGNVSILFQHFQLTTLLRKLFGGFSTSALNWPQAMGWDERWSKSNSQTFLVMIQNIQRSNEWMQKNVRIVKYD